MILLIIFLPVHDAGADSYRCGRKIVRDGDTIAQLLALCGEPRLKSRGAAVIRVDGVDKTTIEPGPDLYHTLLSQPSPPLGIPW